MLEIIQYYLYIPCNYFITNTGGTENIYLEIRSTVQKSIILNEQLPNKRVHNLTRYVHSLLS